jgi:hypothetical protein
MSITKETWKIVICISDKGEFVTKDELISQRSNPPAGPLTPSFVPKVRFPTEVHALADIKRSWKLDEIGNTRNPLRLE